ncbi:MAG TPA: hypothetical protein PKO06_22905 [Candidatus Ozemobacteraceae bacterium]|nr:hypothetical protein [Candidatus Ozemobacteraceae bacterium]
MTITPIDIKTSLVVNTDASRLRENQKAQESGPGQQLVGLQQQKDQQKTETLQQPQATEDHLIRKEDQDSEKRGNQQEAAPGAKPSQPAEEKKPAEPVPDPAGRGWNIDVKA